jgi:hypothetical protein
MESKGKHPSTSDLFQLGFPTTSKCIDMDLSK